MGNAERKRQSRRFHRIVERYGHGCPVCNVRKFYKVKKGDLPGVLGEIEIGCEEDGPHAGNPKRAINH